MTSFEYLTVAEKVALWGPGWEQDVRAFDEAQERANAEASERQRVEQITAANRGIAYQRCVRDHDRTCRCWD